MLKSQDQQDLITFKKRLDDIQKKIQERYDTYKQALDQLGAQVCDYVFQEKNQLLFKRIRNQHPISVAFKTFENIPISVVIEPIELLFSRDTFSTSNQSVQDFANKIQQCDMGFKLNSENVFVYQNNHDLEPAENSMMQRIALIVTLFSYVFGIKDIYAFLLRQAKSLINDIEENGHYNKRIINKCLFETWDKSGKTIPLTYHAASQIEKQIEQQDEIWLKKLNAFNLRIEQGVFSCKKALTVASSLLTHTYNEHKDSSWRADEWCQLLLCCTKALFCKEYGFSKYVMGSLVINHTVYYETFEIEMREFLGVMEHYCSLLKMTTIEEVLKLLNQVLETLRSKGNSLNINLEKSDSSSVTLNSQDDWFDFFYHLHEKKHISTTENDLSATL